MDFEVHMYSIDTVIFNVASTDLYTVSSIFEKLKVLRNVIGPFYVINVGWDF